MAPVQNTFSIIPNFPSAASNADDSATKASRRPMTTKQAKKAYQKANKGPKLSKAEQRRQDLFEQDRIRKEAEKERNQARARAARDRKKEKEDNERADKKQKGLPLVNVRPSQDTIARFVRGFGPPKIKTQQPEKPALECSPANEAAGNIKNRDHACSPPSSPASKVEERRIDGVSEDEPSPKRRRVGDPIDASLDPKHGSNDCSMAPTQEKYSQPGPRKSQEASQRVQMGNSQAFGSGTRRAGEDSTVPSMSPLSPGGAILGSVVQIQSASTSQPKPGSLANEKGREQILPEPCAATTAPFSLSQEFRDIAAILDDDCLNDSFGSIFASPRDKQRSFGSAEPLIGGSSARLAHARSTDDPSVASPKEAKAASDDPELAPKTQNQVQRTFDTKCEASCPQVEKIYEPNLRQPLQPLSATRVNAKVQFLDRDSQSQHTPYKGHDNEAHPQRPSGMLFVTPMGPPPIPSDTSRSRQEIKRPHLSISDAEKASLNVSKQKQVLETSDSRRIKAPSSTQAFMLSHLDDLFPSPSQEIEELYAVDNDRNRKAVNAPRFLRTSQTTKHHAPPRFLSKAQSGQMPKPPTRPTPQRKGVAQQSSGSRNRAPKEPVDVRPSKRPLTSLAGCQVTTTIECFDFPCLSTQDVFLSSQDVQEMETPTNSSRQNRTADPLPSSLSQRSATPTPAFRSRTKDIRHSDEHAGLDKRSTRPASPQARTPGWQRIQNSLRTAGTTRAASRMPEHVKSMSEAKVIGKSKVSQPEPRQASMATTPVSNGQHLARSFDNPSSVENRPGAHAAIAPFRQEEERQMITPAVEQSIAAPRAHAKPFFTSSCRAPLYKYAIERNKTSAWRYQASKKESEAGLDILQQLENERFVNLLDDTEHFPFEEDDYGRASVGQTNRQSSSLQRAETSCEEIPKQTVTGVLNLPTDDRHSPKRPVAEGIGQLPSSGQQQDQKRRLTSYQRMLAELDKAQQNTNMHETNTGEAAQRSGVEDNSELELLELTGPPKSPGPPVPSASQETDYGDIGLDDMMLSMM